MTTFVSIAAILGILLGLMGLLGLPPVRARLAPEMRRKLLHVAMGGVALALPALFDQPGPVWLLALLAAASLLLVRRIRYLRKSIGSAIHTVERVSFGELCYPLGVATLFSLAGDQYLLYLVPLLILALGDSMAALVGVRHGRLRYRTLDGNKSLEGSMTMFVVSFGSVLLPFGFAGTLGIGSLLAGAMCVALALTLVEALAWRGIDNFLLPVAGYYLLDGIMPLAQEQLLPQALLASTAVLTLITLYRFRTGEGKS